MQYNPVPGKAYLYHILSDGAAPFPYRAGVRSLLGVPKGEGSLSFGPTLLPVGFIYPRQRFGNRYPRVTSDAKSRHDEVVPSGQETLRLRKQFVEGDKAGGEEAGAKEKLIDPGTWGMVPRARGRTGEDADESPHAKPSGQAALSPGSAGGVRPIEIPGTSEQKQQFSFSSSVDLAFSPEGIRNKVPRTDEGNDIHEDELPRGQFEHPRHSPVNPPRPLTPNDAHDEVFVHEKGATTTRVEPLMRAIRESDIREAAMPVAMTPQTILVHGSETRNRTPDHNARSGNVREEQEERAPNSVLLGTESIERLRTALRELGSKSSTSKPAVESEPDGDHRMTPRPHSPPAPQPVMIIRRSLLEARVPKAFWERSYLRMFRMRPLR